MRTRQRPLAFSKELEKNSICKLFPFEAKELAMLWLSPSFWQSLTTLQQQTTPSPSSPLAFFMFWQARPPFESFFKNKCVLRYTLVGGELLFKGSLVYKDIAERTESIYLIQFNLFYIMPIHMSSKSTLEIQLYHTYIPVSLTFFYTRK